MTRVANGKQNAPRFASGGDISSVHNMGDPPETGHDARKFGGKSEDMDHDGKAKGGHIRRASGGGADTPKAKNMESVNLYNAQGSPEGKEAKDETPAFMRGGRAKRAGKDAGLATGGLAPARPDRARRASGGGTPYSSAHNLTSPSDSKDSRGYEGTKAA